MIRVTQGSANSHSLKAFRDLLCLLPRKYSSLFKLYERPTLIESIHAALADMSFGDILLNLPAQKADFEYKGKTYAGHTDYYRTYFSTKDLAMCFVAPNANLLLLTDHIPLNMVTTTLNEELIIKKVENALNGMKDYGINIKCLTFLGINPHAGENGMLGSEESDILLPAQKIILHTFPHLTIKTVPSDGYFLINTFKKDTLVVSAYHDQGLSLFKALNGLSGNHLTFGLPFKRMSPIHGTTTDLTDYNQFNSTGILFTMLDAIKQHSVE